MPNPLWMPLIGSGFDDLARQRQWAVGRNDAVEGQNFNRLATAQQTQNSYLAQLSQMQQQEIDRQAAAQESANQEALARRERFGQSVEQRRQFGIGTALEEKKIEAQREHNRFTIDEKNRQERKGLDQVKNWATETADDLDTLAKKQESALFNAQTAATDLELARATLEKSNAGKIVFNPKLKEFTAVPTTLTDPKEAAKALAAGNAAAAQANQSLAAARSDAQRAQESHALVSTEFQQLLAEAGKSYGLTPKKRGNRWNWYSSAHNDYFGKAGQESMTDEGVRSFKNMTGPGWMPSSAATSTGTAAPAASDSGFKVIGDWH